MKHTLLAAIAVALASFTTPMAASAQEVYDVNELTEKPRIASPMAAQQAIQRAYSRSSRAQGVQGRVMLQFVVAPTGKVDASTIVVKNSDSPALTNAAKRAIEDIEFVPGMVDGAAVHTRVVFPITFAAR
jgi:TonB family protein